MKTRTQARRIIKCGIVDHEYCFDTSCVLSVRQGEVLRKEAVPIDGVAGVVSHDGHSSPVFRLDELLGYSTRSDDREHILVLSTGQGICGLMVNRVSRAITVSPEMIAPLPSLAYNADRPFFYGIVNFSDQRGDAEDDIAKIASLDDQETRIQAALLISPEGLFDERSVTEFPFEHAPTNFSRTMYQTGRRRGQLMVFELPNVSSTGNELAIALSITQVLEITNRKPLLYVPGAPSALLGLANWRNHFVPVIDVTLALGLDAAEQDESRLVVARHGDQLLGFHASSSINTVRLPIEAEPCKTSDVTDTSLIHASYVTNDGILLVPALQELALAVST